MALKSSNPYGAASGQSFAMPPDTITAELSKAGGKAKARYPSGKSSLEPGGGAGGNMGGLKAKGRAYTPGGPTGS
jgi:hypothetical protein